MVASGVGVSTPAVISLQFPRSFTARSTASCQRPAIQARGVQSFASATGLPVEHRLHKRAQHRLQRGDAPRIDFVVRLLGHVASAAYLELERFPPWLGCHVGTDCIYD